MLNFIGGNHVHDDKLEELLLKLDYTKSNGTYSFAAKSSRNTFTKGSTVKLIVMGGINSFISIRSQESIK